MNIYIGLILWLVGAVFIAKGVDEINRKDTEKMLERSKIRLEDHYKKVAEMDKEFWSKKGDPNDVSSAWHGYPNED